MLSKAWSHADQPHVFRGIRPVGRRQDVLDLQHVEETPSAVKAAMSSTPSRTHHASSLRPRLVRPPAARWRTRIVGGGACRIPSGRSALRGCHRSRRVSTRAPLQRRDSDIAERTRHAGENGTWATLSGPAFGALQDHTKSDIASGRLGAGGPYRMPPQPAHRMLRTRGIGRLGCYVGSERLARSRLACVVSTTGRGGGRLAVRAIHRPRAASYGVEFGLVGSGALAVDVEPCGGPPPATGGQRVQ